MSSRVIRGSPALRLRIDIIMRVVGHFTKTGSRCHLWIIVDHYCVSIVFVLIRWEWVETSQRWPLIVNATLRFASCLLVFINCFLLRLLLFRPEVADSARVFLWVETVLLLSEEITHSVTLACVHRKGVSRVGPLHKLLGTLCLSKWWQKLLTDSRLLFILQLGLVIVWVRLVNPVKLPRFDTSKVVRKFNIGQCLLHGLELCHKDVANRFNQVSSLIFVRSVKLVSWARQLWCTSIVVRNLTHILTPTPAICDMYLAFGDDVF